jgi:hypothetical protein
LHRSRHFLCITYPLATAPVFPAAACGRGVFYFLCAEGPSAFLPPSPSVGGLPQQPAQTDTRTVSCPAELTQHRYRTSGTARMRFCFCPPLPLSHSNPEPASHLLQHASSPSSHRDTGPPTFIGRVGLPHLSRPFVQPHCTRRSLGVQCSLAAVLETAARSCMHSVDELRQSWRYLSACRTPGRATRLQLDLSSSRWAASSSPPNPS